MKRILFTTVVFIFGLSSLCTLILTHCAPQENPYENGGGNSGNQENQNENQNDDPGDNPDEQTSPNNLPGPMLLLTPDVDETNVSLLPKFRWVCSDADNDPLTYKLFLSSDGINWTSYGPFTDDRSNNETFLPVDLSVYTSYQWFIQASDGKRGGTVNSDTLTFSTSLSYPDGGAKRYMSSAKEHPCVLIFTGDGYVAEDFNYGGKFDSDVSDGIEAFFNIEPFRTYREYFTVYKVAAYSQQRGMSDASTPVNTVFQVKKPDNNTYLECNQQKVLDYMTNVPEVASASITDSLLRNATIVVISNKSVYAGTTHTNMQGVSIALCPVFRPMQIDNGLAYAAVVQHEAGGHGWGKLQDEYDMDNPNTDISTSPSYLALLKSEQESGFGLNIDFTSDPLQVRWRTFIGRTGYEQVGVYEGGALFGKGVWRAEEYSCMRTQSIPYHSVYCRYLIVKRIMEVSQEYTTEDALLTGFLAKDYFKHYNPDTGEVY